jgi:hypothetical protein
LKATREPASRVWGAGQQEELLAVQQSKQRVNAAARQAIRNGFILSDGSPAK